MSRSSSLDRSIRAYLVRSGWQEQSSGNAGTLWRSDSSFDADVIAVPFGTLQPGEFEWRSVVERIASHEHRSADEVATNITAQYTDITHLRAANDFVITGSIPLSAGASLVVSAKEMLRSSATTAQQARSQIAGNYSKIGDDLADQARLGHTIEGSYIIPVLMPLPEQEVDDPQTPQITGLDRERAAPEPAERRVMRTFAEALTAINRLVVQPAREPKSREIPDLVVAGVSREFVTALLRVVNEPAVSTFEATFVWAPATVGPSGIPVKVDIPAASSELLKRTARLLKTSRREVSQTITGPIVEVRHIPDDLFGEVAIQATRGGKPSEIRVRLRLDQIDQTYEWMRASRTVLVEGELVRTPGQPLRIDSPSRFATLESTFLGGSSD